MGIKMIRIRHISKLVTAAFILASSLVTTGCMKSMAATQLSQNEDLPVTESMIKSVNAAFRTTFLGGDWYYQGAQAVNGTINAYIQIPEKLNMSRRDQINYLKQSLCPSSTKRFMWKQLKDVPLSVHVYTFNKQHTIYADCTKPVA